MRGIYACLLAGTVFVQPQTDSRPIRPTVAPPMTEVHQQDVQQRNLPPLPEGLPGISEPAQRVELLAPIDGILAEISVREGQFVRAGQVLARFDDAMAQANVRVAEAAAGPAEVNLAHVDLRLAEAELGRLLSVPDRRALAEVELDRAKAAVDRAKADVERARQANRQAKHTLEVEQQRLQQLYLKAPFDGVVVRISTQQGSSLVRTLPIITIANLSKLRVELFAELRHFNTLTPGDQYILNASAPIDEPIPARLLSREPVIDPATKTFRCVFEIENSSGRLPAGFTVLFDGEIASNEFAHFHNESPNLVAR
ncbi:MAG: efflux RND transporter periplasmic adaptor subunit [Planctomycetaceae bacterium]